MSKDYYVIGLPAAAMRRAYNRMPSNGLLCIDGVGYSDWARMYDEAPEPDALVLFESQNRKPVRYTYETARANKYFAYDYAKIVLDHDEHIYRVIDGELRPIPIPE